MKEQYTSDSADGNPFIGGESQRYLGKDYYAA